MAEWICSLCALTASTLFYMYLRETANRWIALAATLLVQVNFYYAYVAMRPLAEAVFWLVLACYLLLLLRLLRGDGGTRKGLSILTGLSCGLVFLSKQIGGLLIVHMIALLLFTALTRSGGERTARLKGLMWGLAGWCLVVLPYSAVIFHQTGHHPLRQQFRKGEYRIAVADPEVRDEIARIKALPEKDYGMLYAKRRLMRRLLPNASEMFCFAETESEKGPGPVRALLSLFRDPNAYMVGAFSNFMNLRDILGSLLLYLFLVSCVSPFLLRPEGIGLPARMLLPCFILLYLLVMSCFTDTISRYIHILFPFVIMHIAGELFVFSRAMAGTLKRRVWGFLIPCVAFGAFAAATPKYFNALGLFPKVGFVETGFKEMRDRVRGEPVFSLFPFPAYLSGGLYRVLPNDSLEKVAAYGRRTGVRWLLISWTGHTRSELTFYNRAGWYETVPWKAGIPVS